MSNSKVNTCSIDETESSTLLYLESVTHKYKKNSPFGGGEHVFTGAVAIIKR